MDNLITVNHLNKIVLSHEDQSLETFFHESFKKNSNEFINLINDENLNFTSLFILRYKIQELNLRPNLNSRNKIALEIISVISTGEKNIRTNEYFFLDYVQGVHSVLKWMIKTGFEYDGIDNDYDEILDISLILLTKIYRDKTILPILVELIFKRYKKGFLIHDLMWAFYECGDPKSLIIIAQHLQSSDLKDVELSRKLLNFIPGIDTEKNTNNSDYYLYFLNWFEENFLFLYFTGESFQQCSNPAPYKSVLEAKYLCSAVSSVTGKILRPLTEYEVNLLELFKKLDDTTKLLLSTFSFTLHHKNIYNWNKWLHYPMAEQIKIAKIGGVQ
jgi:hypothetical protein